MDDRLFVTLDAKTRQIYRGPERHALLSDTVGFIRHLPHSLVASFRSTLDVAVASDMLLLVLDAIDTHCAHHVAVVASTLRISVRRCRRENCYRRSRNVKFCCNTDW